jgi:hypothetical protein
MAENSISIPAHDIQAFQDARQAVQRIEEIYRSSIKKNIRTFKKFAAGRSIQSQSPVDAFYPYVFITVETEVKDLDPRLSGFLYLPWLKSNWRYSKRFPFPCPLWNAAVRLGPPVSR